MTQLPYIPGRFAAAYYTPTNKTLSSPTESSVDAWFAGNGADAPVLVDNMTDVQYDMQSDMADATTRGTARSGFNSNIPVLKNGQITFECRWLPSVARPTGTSAPVDFTGQLFWAWQYDATIAMVFLDWEWARVPPVAGQTISPQGIASNWTVSLNKSEDLRDIQRASITLSVAESALWYHAPTLTGV